MGSVLKSLDGIPDPAFPIPRDVVLADEARTARRRFYPVTVLYTAYALPLLSVALFFHPGRASGSLLAGVAFWTLLEYLVHRYVLHGRFPDGLGFFEHRMHAFFDTMHGDHHQRPWDGMYINGYLDSMPFAALFVLIAFLTTSYYEAPVFVAALLQSYVIEEWVHYSVHFCYFKSRYFRYIRHHHWYHHSRRGAELAFGLTSGLWDAVSGTPIPVRHRFRVHRFPSLASARPGEGRALLLPRVSLRPDASGPKPPGPEPGL